MAPHPSAPLYARVFDGSVRVWVEFSYIVEFRDGTSVTFQGRTQFTTWAYTLAVRQRTRAARRQAETPIAGPEAFPAFLIQHAGDPRWDPEDEAVHQELCSDVRLSFRQRLARARAVLRELMGRRCGLIREANPCRCDRMVRASEDRGLLDPRRPAFARQAGVELPIAVTTLQSAAAELDVAVACGSWT